jgi:hypothetical protein
MATTPNYGWVTPAPSDLVTDLPADFETFADAVDADLAGLLGGTTGQVLKKTSNSDHAFAFGVDPTFDLVTTAGDLVYGTAADTMARLAIGTAGQVLKVNSGATAPEWGAAAGAADISVKLIDGSASLTSTYTDIAFTTEQFDTDTMHSNVTNTARITFTTGGKYLVGGNVCTTTNGVYGIRLLLDGGTVLNENSGGNSGAVQAASITTIYDFNQGSYLTLQGKSGANQNAATDQRTQFWAVKL